MKNNENLLTTILFGLLGLAAWLFPNIELKLKILIAVMVVLSICLLYLRDKLTFFFRKNWQFILSIFILIISFLIFYRQFFNLLLPFVIILISSTSISLLISFKYKQQKIIKSRKLIKTIPFESNSAWKLNHWKSKCSSIVNNEMHFEGTQAPKDVDGSHIDLNNILKIGNSYEVECFVKSEKKSDAKFLIWCHDKTNKTEDNGISVRTQQIFPKRKGEFLSLVFRAEYNENIRIHLQYIPGKGKIIVRDLKIYKIIE